MPASTTVLPNRFFVLRFPTKTWNLKQGQRRKHECIVYGRRRRVQGRSLSRGWSLHLNSFIGLKFYVFAKCKKEKHQNCSSHFKVSHDRKERRREWLLFLWLLFSNDVVVPQQKRLLFRQSRYESTLFVLYGIKQTCTSTFLCCLIVACLVNMQLGHAFLNRWMLFWMFLMHLFI